MAGRRSTASLNQPYEIRFDRSGNMYFADMQNHVVRRVDAKTQIISTVAGTGEAGLLRRWRSCQQGAVAPAAQHRVRSRRRLLICDIGNHRIRRVDLKTGTDRHLRRHGRAQADSRWCALDGAPLNGPRAMAVRRGRRPVPGAARRQRGLPYRCAPGPSHHVAGTGENGYTRRRRPAVQTARLSGPRASPAHPAAASISPTPKATPSAAWT